MLAAVAERAVPDAEDMTGLVLWATESFIYVWYPYAGTVWEQDVEDPGVDVTELVTSGDFASRGLPDLTPLEVYPAPSE